MQDIVFILLLMIGIYYDFKEQLIPDVVPVGLMTYGYLSFVSDMNWISFEQIILGMSIGFLIFIIPFMIGGMGYGDIKLMTALGVWLGIKILDVAVYSCIIGLIFSIYYFLKTKDRKTSLPFGPSISIAAGIVWYLHPPVLSYLLH